MEKRIEGDKFVRYMLFAMMFVMILACTIQIHKLQEENKELNEYTRALDKFVNQIIEIQENKEEYCGCRPIDFDIEG